MSAALRGETVSALRRNLEDSKAAYVQTVQVGSQTRRQTRSRRGRQADREAERLMFTHCWLSRKRQGPVECKQGERDREIETERHTEIDRQTHRDRFRETEARKRVQGDTTAGRDRGGLRARQRHSHTHRHTDTKTEGHGKAGRCLSVFRGCRLTDLQDEQRLRRFSIVECLEAQYHGQPLPDKLSQSSCCSFSCYFFLELHGGPVVSRPPFFCCSSSLTAAASAVP